MSIETQNRACQMLLAAIIARAIFDTFLDPVKTEKFGFVIDSDAMSAFEFLSDPNNPYMPFLEIEPETFWKTFTKKMFSDYPVHGYNDSQKRAFKINYKLWQQTKAFEALWPEQETSYETLGRPA